MKRIGFLLLIVAVSCSTPFTGKKAKTDSSAPNVIIDSHQRGDLIRGVVTIAGTATDDIRVRSCEICVVDYTEEGVKEKRLEKIKLNGKKDNWSFQIDTTKISEGEKIFRIFVEDTVGKVTMASINLVVDNKGPYVTILEPQPKSSDNFIAPFQVKVVLVDDIGLKALTWELVSESNTSHMIQGIIDADLKNVMDFEIDPSLFVSENTGFLKGWCVLSVRCMNENNLATEVASKRLYIDFIQDLPLVILETPHIYEDSSFYETMGPEILVRGTVSDDDAVAGLELWYTSVTNPEGETIQINFDKPESIIRFEEIIKIDNDGEYELQVRGVDIYGTRGFWSGIARVRVSNTMPTIEFNAPANDSLTSKNVTIEATVNANSTYAIAQIRYSINGNVWTDYSFSEAQTVNYQHVWDSTTANEEGVVYYSIEATDNIGQITTRHLRFIVDNTPPVLTIITPSEPAMGINGDYLISGTAKDWRGENFSGIVSKVTLAFDGAAEQEAIGTEEWAYVYNSLVDSDVDGFGEVELVVRAYDDCNNMREKTILLEIDQAADIPQANITYPAADSWVGGHAVFAGTAIDDDGIDKVYLRIDYDEDNHPAPPTDWVEADYSDGLWSYHINAEDIAGGDGRHRLYCYAVDINNVASEIVSVYFVRNSFVPTIWVAPGENENIRASSQITGDVWQENQIDTIKSVELMFDGAKKDGSAFSTGWLKSGFTINNINTNHVTFRYTPPLGILRDGICVVQIKAKDSQGREARLTRRVYLDTVAPVGSFSSPAAMSACTGATVTLRGSLHDDGPPGSVSVGSIRARARQASTGVENVIITGDRGNIDDDTIASGSLDNWTYEWEIDELDDGLYNLYLMARDRAGNIVPEVAYPLRIMHYPPQLTNVQINGEAFQAHMKLPQIFTITGNASDNIAGDPNQGLARVELHLHDDLEIIEGRTAEAICTVEENVVSKEFAIEHTNTKKANYLTVRAIDLDGGYVDVTNPVWVDIEPPREDFKYSTIGYAPLWKAKPFGFGSSVCLLLNILDDSITSGATVDLKAGSSPLSGNVLGERRFLAGDICAINLQDYQADLLYLSYTITDLSGNSTSGQKVLYRDMNMMSVDADFEITYVLSGNTVSGTASAGDKSIHSVKISTADGGVESLREVAGTANWTYTFNNVPSDGKLHEFVLCVTAGDGIDYLKTIYVTLE